MEEKTKLCINPKYNLDSKENIMKFNEELLKSGLSYEIEKKVIKEGLKFLSEEKI